ncbi:autotransporter outer membrane beta-barrel domain-containing protein [Escherichia coli]
MWVIIGWRISGYSAGLYATWYQNDANKTGAYVDSWALYNWFDNSVSSDNRSATTMILGA